MSPAIESLERTVESMAGELPGALAFPIQVQVKLDIVFVLCAMCVLSALLGFNEEAVSTTCQTQRNPMFPNRSFNREV